MICVLNCNVFFQVNPFRDRICRVFSSDDTGAMTFEDFLDMMSVFSDNAPKNVKVEYAFRIYGKYMHLGFVVNTCSVYNIWSIWSQS